MSDEKVPPKFIIEDKDGLREKFINTEFNALMVEAINLLKETTEDFHQKIIKSEENLNIKNESLNLKLDQTKKEIGDWQKETNGLVRLFIIVVSVSIVAIIIAVFSIFIDVFIANRSMQQSTQALLLQKHQQDLRDTIFETYYLENTLPKGVRRIK